MQAITLDLSKSVCGSDERVIYADIHLSLKPFITFIEQRIQTEKTGKVNFYKYLLAQFDAYPELAFPIQEESVAKYHQLFELVYTALSPILNDEKEQLWAVSRPILPCFYYGTDAFYNIILDHHTSSLKEGITLPSKREMEQSMLNNFYNLILQKFYNFSLAGSDYMIKSVIDSETHLLKYYRLNIDVRFLDIKANMPLPEFSLDNMKEYMNDEVNSLEILQNLLPSKMFSIEGLSIVTFTDVTTEYALESIKSTIIDHNQCQDGWDSTRISTALKSLVGSDLLDFGLLPYLKLNSKTIIYNHTGFESIIITKAKETGMAEEEYTSMVETFVSHPHRMIFPQINIEGYSAYPMLKLLFDTGIKSYALYPLYYNGKLVGCLEVYAKDITAFNSNTLSRIENAFPLLAQLYQNIIIDFNNEIMNVVTDKFTALQPSVSWRFYQVAFNYLKSGGFKKNLPVETVQFKNVFPFYGAIDIRNSSIERNLMIRKDLFNHFDILENTFTELQKILPNDMQDEFPKHKSGIVKKSEGIITDREIMKTDDYLQRQLPPYLNLIKAVHPDAEELIENYFKHTRPGGKVFENRDNYELTMQMINHAVNRHLDEFNAEIQEIYPCYFEKFRTDGVEFDIYLGHSISPDRDFSDDIVSDIRYRQLKVIAEIARTTAGLKEHLAIPLETTQLVFVYEKMIDISFRIDEQRFDVEGGYNIRYQMVKKRIDKAHVKDSNERLTQPGKIAIVYFNNTEAQEYMVYIKALQQENLLTDFVEYIEIEELQGVEGLKALRVEVAESIN